MSKRSGKDPREALRPAKYFRIKKCCAWARRIATICKIEALKKDPTSKLFFHHQIADHSSPPALSPHLSVWKLASHSLPRKKIPANVEINSST
jgi:hypothetical protein